MAWVILLMAFFQKAWIALVSALIAIVVLAVLAQLLRSSAAVAIGGSRQMGEAVSASVGIVLLAIFALLGVPALVSSGQAVFPSQCASGLNTLATACTQLIGALVALRLLKSVVISIAMTSLGGNVSLSQALVEAAEAIVGMALVGVAAPIASYFLYASC